MARKPMIADLKKITDSHSLWLKVLTGTVLAHLLLEVVLVLL